MSVRHPQLQSQEQNWLEPKSAANEQDLFPKVRPHASTTSIPHAGSSQESCALLWAHQSMQGFEHRVHTTAWNTSAVL